MRRRTGLLLRSRVSELKEFYEFEYYAFELLASGQLLDLREAGEKNIKHLVAYGIVGQNNGDYLITIPVIGKYVGNELAKSEADLSFIKSLTTIVEKRG